MFSNRILGYKPFTLSCSMQLDDTERFESKKKSDQLGDLSKCYACRMTGKHVSFMKGKSRPPQAIRLCLALPAAWMPLVVECSHANSHVDLTCHAAALTQIQIFQCRTKQGVFRKKLPPDVRDDPMEGRPAQRNMSL